MGGGGGLRRGEKSSEVKKRGNRRGREGSRVRLTKYGGTTRDRKLVLGIGMRG